MNNAPRTPTQRAALISIARETLRTDDTIPAGLTLSQVEDTLQTLHFYARRDRLPREPLALAIRRVGYLYAPQWAVDHLAAQW